MILGQLSWGQPWRGEEIAGLRLVNGINRDRNVFIIDGEVVLITQYHKSLAHFDFPKVVPKFLSERVGQLLVMYIVYIRPLTDRWEADCWASHGQMNPPSDFIWHSEKGLWKSSQISRAMSKWTQHYMGRRITLQDWRHIRNCPSARSMLGSGVPQSRISRTATSTTPNSMRLAEGAGWGNLRPSPLGSQCLLPCVQGTRPLGAWRGV